MAKISEKQIEACRKLGMSEKEITDMYDDDADVEKGIEMPWDLSKEEHKKAMKYANVDEHKKPTAKAVAEPTEQKKKAPTVYNWNTEGKQKKENTTKVEIIASLAQYLTENGFEGVEITNKQGKIGFKVGDTDFSLSLTQHRKK